MMITLQDIAYWIQVNPLNSGMPLIF